MDILVDYDNIERAIRHMGLEHVVRKIADVLEPCIDTSHNRLDFRLYGGWYEGRNLSRMAQRLLTEIRRTFPLALGRKNGTPLGVVNVNLALSLMCDPRTTVTHTFRTRGLPPNIRCESPPWLSCVNKASCPIADLTSLFNTGLCPETSCPVTPETILCKQEQKMVDTMIVADILHHSAIKSKCAVVTSDDDIWPGIKAAIIAGSDILHVQKNPVATIFPLFRALPSPQYQCIQMV